jgi:hypothetical protein
MVLQFAGPFSFTKGIAMTESDSLLEYEIRRKLRWHRDGANWILLYGRRRMGRVIPDGQRLRIPIACVGCEMG